MMQEAAARTPWDQNPHRTTRAIGLLAGAAVIAALSLAATGIVQPAMRLPVEQAPGIALVAGAAVLLGLAALFAGYRIVAWNIRRRLAAEDQLASAHAQLALTEKVASLGHWRATLPDLALHWSAEVFNIFGLDPATSQPTVVAAIAAVHPDDRAAIEYAFQRAVDAGEPYAVTLRIVRPDGDIRHIVARGFCEVDRGGRRIAVFGTVNDVTTVHQADAARRRTDNRYRLLAENTSDLFMLGHDDGRKSYISPAVIRLLGFTPDELAAMRLRDYVHPDDLQRLYAATSRLGQGETEVAIDYRALHKDGRWIWVEGVFRRIAECSGPDDPTIVATFRSIDERRLQAAELEKAKDAAEAAARAKADFLANMSHELRTPLTGLLGACDLLANDASLGPAQRQLCEMATQSGRILLAIVNDVLDFSKIESGSLTLENVPCNLRALVENTQAFVAPEAWRKGLRLSVEIAAGVPDTMMGDPIRLRQLLLNLLSNAVKFTDRGHVGLSVTTAEGGEKLKFTVEDTGIGIAAERLPQLFERFTQADSSIARRFGGSGLGLAICKRIVELMQGCVGVESSPGQGARFWFAIPYAPAQSHERPWETSAAAQTKVGSLRLLLAEDNDINRKIIAAALQAKGHTVVTAVDGAAAAEAYGKGRFDAVLMDIQMPGTDGLVATALIRALEAARGLPPTPVIALTANALAPEVKRCVAAGMNDHVAKPVVWETLFATLDRHVGLSAAPRKQIHLAPNAPLFTSLGRRKISELLASSDPMPNVAGAAPRIARSDLSLG